MYSYSESGLHRKDVVILFVDKRGEENGGLYNYKGQAIMSNRIYNYSDFYNSVEKQVLKSRSAFPEKEVKAFLKENEDLIIKKYRDAASKHKSGEYTTQQVNIGATSSVAYCLSLMF